VSPLPMGAYRSTYLCTRFHKDAIKLSTHSAKKIKLVSGRTYSPKYLEEAFSEVRVHDLAKSSLGFLLFGGIQSTAHE
jgi:hypothetical protein